MPVSLPASYKAEALALRNKLLLFRFRNRGVYEIGENLVDRSIEPRLNQIFLPLMAIIEDPATKEEIRGLARRYHEEMVAERAMDVEAQILEIIRDILASPEEPPLSIREITNWFSDRYCLDYVRRITPKWIGGIVRRRLKLATQKSQGVFIIPITEQSKLSRLFDLYPFLLWRQ